MAFIKNGSTIVSFASSDDLGALDARLFEANEGLDTDYCDGQLIRSTERVLQAIRASEWWREYYLSQNTSTVIATAADIPPVNPAKILSRQNDFTDLTCYYALYNYILPHIADFGTEDSAERKKMGYYQQKYDLLFGELIQAGDWYDFDGSGTVNSAEKQPGVWNLRRVR